MKYLYLVLLASAAFPTGSASAQDTQHGPDSNTHFTVPGIEVLTIPEKPFIAKDRIEWTRHLEDGSAIELHLDANVARDSQGRLYRERRQFHADPNAEALLTEKIYIDPAAQTKTTCTVATRQCLITTYRQATKSAERPEGPFANGTRSLSRMALGTNTMEGLDVVGTKETVTIQPGVIGNEQVMVTTKEYWYSPALETNLSVIRNDPRVGTQTINLTALSRSEPESSLFEVPAGFSVRDARPPAVRPLAENR